jgi:hypothetical protein
VLVRVLRQGVQIVAARFAIRLQPNLQRLRKFALAAGKSAISPAMSLHGLP